MDMDYAAFRDGDCIAIADAGFDGGAADEWRALGYHVRLTPRTEACQAHRAYVQTLPALSELPSASSASGR